MSSTISRAIYILTSADILIVSAYSFIIPLFAIFVTDQIEGATITTVGFYTAIYWIVKSIVQIPIARYLDKKEGEVDEYHALILGYFIAAGVAFGYIFARNVWHIYLLEGILGIADALGVPSYLSIFSRHLDRARENMEWTLRSVGVGITAAGAGALAGILVKNFGFNSVFVLGGVLSLISASSLFLLKPYLKTRDGRSMVYQISKPPRKKTF
ncbi:MAG: MFS transporter [Candidatus Niyogibacteria bacterium]|nr:MAG: MFS transporter [Candidatus Niyogibacteria bacterium]